MATKNDYLPIAEASSVFGVDVSYIQTLINDGAVKSRTRKNTTYVHAHDLNAYLKRKQQLEKEQQPNRIEEMEEKVNQTNSLVRTIGLLFSDVIDSIAELGSLIPILELFITAVAFYGAGLSDVYGWEVMVGLILAQFSALFLTAHYKNIAMHWLGDFAVYASVFFGALNTFIAVFLVLTHGSGNEIPDVIWFIPAVSSGLAVLWIYVAKLFTQERVLARSRLKHEAKMELAEFSRKANFELTQQGILDNIELTKLSMEEQAVKTISEADFMLRLQVTAMVKTYLSDVLKKHSISEKSEEGKRFIQEAKDGLTAMYGLPDLDSSGIERNPDFFTNNQNPHQQWNQPTPATNGHNSNGHG